MITGATAVYALLGRPVAHSRSPELYQHLFAAHGLDAVYVCLEVAPRPGAAVVDALRTLGLAGCNLTIPLKEEVVPHLDEVAGVAGVIEAVNTVVRDEGRLVGHNTDAGGFVDGLRSAHGDVVTGARCVILGAGGAALAVAAGLAEAGAREVVLLNRTPARADRVAHRIGRAFPGVHTDAGGLDGPTFTRAMADADVIVQATAGPGARLVGTFDPAAVPPSAVWCDLNYWMHEPPLQAALAARGVRFHGGLPMLVHQAARAFTLFTGISPDTARLQRVIG